MSPYAGTVYLKVSYHRFDFMSIVAWHGDRREKRIFRIQQLLMVGNEKVSVAP